MGLHRGDLRGTVLPLISIDQYKSKIGDDREVVVLAFFCTDEEPAQDLARFISKLPIQILDAEAAPVPTEIGEYPVFVEIERSEHALESIDTIMTQQRMVTDIDSAKFAMNIYHEDDGLDYDIDTVRDLVNLSADIVPDDTDLREFFYHSTLQNVILTDDFICLEGFKGMFDVVPGVLTRHPQRYQPTKLTESRIKTLSRMQESLGEGWHVDCSDHHVFITNERLDQTLVATFRNPLPRRRLDF